MSAGEYIVFRVSGCDYRGSLEVPACGATPTHRYHQQGAAGDQWSFRCTEHAVPALLDHPSSVVEPLEVLR